MINKYFYLNIFFILLAFSFNCFAEDAETKISKQEKINAALASAKMERMKRVNSHKMDASSLGAIAHKNQYQQEMRKVEEVKKHQEQLEKESKKSEKEESTESEMPSVSATPDLNSLMKLTNPLK